MSAWLQSFMDQAANALGKGEKAAEEPKAEAEAAAEDAPAEPEAEAEEPAAEEPAAAEDEPQEAEDEDDGTPKQAKLEDSNIAGIGSDEDKALRKAAAETERAFKGAGRKVGVEVWRVENRRTEDDKPAFGVKRWPKEDYGTFFTGDSYIVLNTYKQRDPITGKATDRLAWDVHFWIGRESSQDEYGVAAYKTVELDNLLDDGPVQHRETQYNESKLFQSYFKEITYMAGGIASGFRKVKPEEYDPRLFMVRSSGRTTRAFQVACEIDKLNNGDVFILDTGRKVYRFVGEGANSFERNKGGLLQSNIVNSRNGKARKAEVDDEFWKVLGGGPEDVRPADDPFLPEGVTDGPEPRLDRDGLKLFRISDESGSVAFTQEAEGGKIPLSLLDPRDVFLMVSNVGIFVWLGGQASKSETSQSMSIADSYIKENGLDPATTITALREKNALDNHLFVSLFNMA